MFNFRLQTVICGTGSIGKEVDGIEARIGPESVDEGSRVLTVFDVCGDFSALRRRQRIQRNLIDVVVYGKMNAACPVVSQFD